MRDFEHPLRLGVDTFRTYVEAWYEGKFQDVVFSTNQQTDIREMLSSILAGMSVLTVGIFALQPAHVALIATADGVKERNYR